jgi:hypothetical protein
MKVTIAEGRALRDPLHKRLYKAGEIIEVPDTSLYWRRRVRDGDATTGTPTPAPAHAHAQRHHAKPEE